MVARSLIALLALTASCAFAQQYSTNYVEGDYDYQDQGAAPAPHPAPAPPQRSIRPAPQQQTLRQSGPTTTRAPPVAILKQINRHNDDGSYTYGFEGADGSFKIETKLATGEVMGKYGYVDDTGKVRTVEYGANKFGFQPVGEGITVAAPTLVDETRLAKGDRAPDYDDGQYYEEAVAPVAQRPRVQSQPQPQRPRPAGPRPKSQPQQQYFENSYQQQQPQVLYSQQPHIPRVSQNLGPVPPRAQIAGAAPVPTSDVLFRPPAPSAQHRQFASPPQQRTEAHFPRPQAPRQYPAQPAPVHQTFESAPPRQQFQAQPPPRPQHQARNVGGGSGGFFDQLTKDYALPAGHSTPTHDISFGLY